MNRIKEKYFIEAIEEQPLNAKDATLFIEAGVLMEASLSQPSKALVPISVTLVPSNVTLVRESQS